jgi:TolB protein
MIRTAWVFVFVFLVPVGALLGQQAQIETGTRTGASSIRLALPQFPSLSADTETAEANDANDVLAAAFNETLWNDIDFSGVISLISPDFYPLGSFGNPADIDPEEWISTAVDAQFMGFGNMSLNQNRFVLEARIWDLRTRVEDRELEGRRYIGEMNERSVRLIAHQFADLIIQTLGGGIEGVAQTKIAFESDRVGGGNGNVVREIFVMDYDGANDYQLTTLHSLAVTPNWSPDGQMIGYTSYARDKADIAVISPIDRRGFRFSTLSGTTTTPAWSPDGDRIAFSSSMNELRGVPDMELYVSDVRGENRRRLTSSRGVDISPAWNPSTGREIAFVSDRNGAPQIYIMDAEGGNVRRIVEGGGNAGGPAWSPDGLTIAFHWQRNGAPFDIYIYDIATDRTVQLTRSAGNNESPSWSPDGRHLVFESSRSGSRQIYSMLADGTKVRRLTSQGNNVNPSWSGYMGE